MKKMNKKGFTLIEMLVVIAIIAVLVAIVIPTVTSATDKAAAATTAANLRSIKAEITTAFLSNDTTKYTFTETKDASGNVTGYTVGLANASVALPKAKKCDVVAADAEIGATISVNKEVTVFYVVGEAGYTIANFTEVAEGRAIGTAGKATGATKLVYTAPAGT